MAYTYSVATPFDIAQSENLAGFANSHWDVVIIGAGVAGAAAAIMSSQSGFRTLLVEAKSFPREKVCGGCLNRRAQASLKRLGILEQLYRVGAVPINELHLKVGGTSVVWKIPTLLSVRRSTLDRELVRAAIDAGATFIDNVSGLVMPRTEGESQKNEFREVSLQHTTGSKEQRATILAKSILIADGLTRSSLRLESGWSTEIQLDSRIGVQRVFPANHFVRQPIIRGQLHMIVGSDGYVGFSHTDGDQVDVAGAIDPKSIRKQGGIAATICGILGRNEGVLSVCTAPGENLDSRDDSWSATPALTRSSIRVASDRVFLIGDSIGYVEPFTGEGMSWALASAEAVMPIVSRSVTSPSDTSLPKQWTTWVDSQRWQKQRTCSWISRQLRCVSMAAWTLRICNYFYPIRALLIKKVTS